MDTEDSGSIYETSDEALSSPDGAGNRLQTSTETTTKSFKAPSTQQLPDSINIKTNEKLLEGTIAWSAQFKAPLLSGDTGTPSRKATHANSVAKRKSQRESYSKGKAKRLKPYYSDEYRMLLNENIEDAATGVLEEDFPPLNASQIGSSFWTVADKDIFFSALARLGRDDIRGISARVGTKSEVEVHEYILLLNQGLGERQSKCTGIIESVEFPAALEVSGECCAILERAGDAITARQEVAAEKVEKEKWGDSWLLTKDVSRWIEKNIRQKDRGDEMAEALPAVTLLNLNTWLELCQEIFMNSSQEEDNWKSIADLGETPAIRATAFEDFHSLTVSITKRLISTTLFCTMSRMRARDFHKVKHAEVTCDDVEAAVKILGLKDDKNRFWIECARRCNLLVIDNEQDGDDEDQHQSQDQQSVSEEDKDDVIMSYEAVEASLRTTARRSRSRSRSRSVSRPPRASYQQQVSQNELYQSSPNHSSPETDFYSSVDSDLSNPPSPPLDSADPVVTLAETHDAYAEAIDTHASLTEEMHLWGMLNQTAPFEIEIASVAALERPHPLPADAEGREWRDSIEYRTEWETCQAPVPEAAFGRNRERLSRVGKRKTVMSLESEEDEAEDGGQQIFIDKVSRDARLGEPENSVEGGALEDTEISEGN
jgi:RNA polymerase I-specific transcription initiation factor RRN5